MAEASAMDTGPGGTVRGAGESNRGELSNIPLQDRPTCIICLGMAGSGKTTFVQVWRPRHVS